MPTGVWAIVVAGGDGRRFGRPKQFEVLAGRSVLSRAIDGAHSITDNVVVVLPADQLSEATQHGEVTAVACGGSTRSASVRSGLSRVPLDAEIILVHDAARPLASSTLFANVTNAVANGADAAIPGLAVTDTIKRVQKGNVVETLDRSTLVAVQTPQAFRATILRAAHEGEPDATDDAALVEALGYTVEVVPGEIDNVKLTERSDLVLLESALVALDATASAEIAQRS